MPNPPLPGPVQTRIIWQGMPLKKFWAGTFQKCSPQSSSWLAEQFIKYRDMRIKWLSAGVNVFGQCSHRISGMQDLDGLQKCAGYGETLAEILWCNTKAV